MVVAAFDRPPMRFAAIHSRNVRSHATPPATAICQRNQRAQGGQPAGIAFFSVIVVVTPVDTTTAGAMLKKSASSLVGAVWYAIVGMWVDVGVSSFTSSHVTMSWKGERSSQACSP